MGTFTDTNDPQNKAALEKLDDIMQRAAQVIIGNISVTQQSLLKLENNHIAAIYVASLLTRYKALLQKRPSLAAANDSQDVLVAYAANRAQEDGIIMNIEDTAEDMGLPDEDAQKIKWLFDQLEIASAMVALSISADPGCEKLSNDVGTALANCKDAVLAKLDQLEQQATAAESSSDGNTATVTEKQQSPYVFFDVSIPENAEILAQFDKAFKDILQKNTAAQIDKTIQALEQLDAAATQDVVKALHEYKQVTLSCPAPGETNTSEVYFGIMIDNMQRQQVISSNLVFKALDRFEKAIEASEMPAEDKEKKIDALNEILLDYMYGLQDAGEEMDDVPEFERIHDAISKKLANMENQTMTTEEQANKTEEVTMTAPAETLAISAQPQGLFYDVSTPEKKRLMDEFDKAANTYKRAALGYIETAEGLHAKNVSFMKTLKQEKNLIQKIPLPSEMNTSEEKLDLAIQLAGKEAELRAKVIAEAQDLADSKANDQKEIMGIFNAMQEAAGQTIGRPEFSEIGSALFRAMSNRRAA